MKHVLIPSAVDTTDEKLSARSVDTTVQLGGYFYDRIVDGQGNLVGVRYWMQVATDFMNHPVFSFFKNDRRLNFDNDGRFVDLVFSASDADALHHGDLRVEVTQEFGGDETIRCDRWLGVSFDLD